MGNIERSTGGYNDPNVWAMFVLFAIVIILFFIEKYNLLKFFTLLFFMYLLIHSYSKTGIIIFACIMLYYLILQYIKKRIDIRYFIIILFSLFVVFYFVLPNTIIYSNYIGRFYYDPIFQKQVDLNYITTAELPHIKNLSSVS